MIKKASAFFVFVYICIVMQQISPCNEYRIKIMHVYYIAMEINVLVYTNILLSFYFLYVIIMSYHFLTMYLT
jgi:hypothetical protein